MSNLTETQQTTLEAAAKRPNGSIHPLPDNVKGGAAKKVIKALHQQGLIEEIETDVWRITKTGYAAIGMEAPQEIEEESDTDNAGGAETADNEATLADTEADATNDSNQPDEEPGDADFEADVAAAEQSVEAADETLPEVIDTIAKQYIQDHGFRVTRENLEKALLEAFKAGQASNTPKTRTPRENSKKAIVMALLQRPEGASLQQIEQSTGWNSNTVRGFLSLAKKKQGLNLETFRTRMHGTNMQGAPGSFTVYKVVP
ncbi:MAG: DUF3489 domain-containing protein [Magnetococcales bacterium]|nr:DUF3489 domain-containing protein [Magnetococcales bacterium]